MLATLRDVRPSPPLGIPRARVAAVGSTSPLSRRFVVLQDPRPCSRTRCVLATKDGVVFAENVFAGASAMSIRNASATVANSTSDYLERIRGRVQIRGREAIVVGLVGEQVVSSFVKRLGDVSPSCEIATRRSSRTFTASVAVPAHQNLGSP